MNANKNKTATKSNAEKSTTEKIIPENPPIAMPSNATKVEGKKSNAPNS